MPMYVYVRMIMCVVWRRERMCACVSSLWMPSVRRHLVRRPCTDQNAVRQAEARSSP